MIELPCGCESSCCDAKAECKAAHREERVSQCAVAIMIDVLQSRAPLSPAGSYMLSGDVGMVGREHDGRFQALPELHRNLSKPQSNATIVETLCGAVECCYVASGGRSGQSHLVREVDAVDVEGL